MPGVNKIVKHTLKSERVVDHFVEIRHFRVNDQRIKQCSRYHGTSIYELLDKPLTDELLEVLFDKLLD